MSEKKDNSTIEQLEKELAEERVYDKLNKEAKRDRIVVDHQKMRAAREAAEQDKEDLEKIKSSNFGLQSDEQIEEIIKNNTEYIEAAKNKMGFILKSKDSVDVSFDRVVPFFRKNIILIGAPSGDGKSTTVANITFALLKQINPATGKPARILIITNEEKTEDIFNRITCLGKGWTYGNHDTFTPEQVETFNQTIPGLSKRITVIDQFHNKSHHVTTSIEGIEGIFENLIAKGDHYDAIIIDYYQNVCISKRNATLGEYEVQAKLTRMLDNYKNIYPAPIVVLAQLNPNNETNENWFPAKLQGRKLIINVATCILEMIVDKKMRITKWKVWKSRFNGCVGEVIETGFDNGRFVPCTEQFKTSMLEYWDQREKALLDRKTDEKHKEEFKNNVIKDAFEKKDENGTPK